MSALAEAVERVRLLRAVRDEQKEIVNAKRLAFEESIAAEADMVHALGMDVLAAENEAKALALNAFKADPTNKKPSGGVQIKVTTTLTYDADRALAWAKETKMALLPERLDETALLKIAKATPLPFVTATETPTAQLASELPELITTTGAPF